LNDNNSLQATRRVTDFVGGGMMEFIRRVVNDITICHTQREHRLIFQPGLHNSNEKQAIRQSRQVERLVYGQLITVIRKIH
jgi:hypothetical protein